ncbi:uncharacterized protein LOC129227095 [Uloborus diversus]|uniref:uncharacterized protein LOC129227095 n=1 Tax=Uloborus diversus TaxID=327109 RepID=UPI0024096AC1|nr:uncharacterized protein LOC129227095 [Uloborus diversus]
MDSGKLTLSFIWLFSFGVFILSEHFTFGKELYKEVICYNDVLRLSCGSSNFIAIHEAFYTTESQENQTCQLPAPENEYIEDESMEVGSSNSSPCHEDIRISLNKACSGSSSCIFNGTLQESNIQCRVRGGQFVVRYDCVPDKNLNKFCNSKVQAREGYISSPGFPKYYPKLDNCSWNLEGSAGQTILLKILHLHTTQATEVYPTVADPDAYAPGILGLLRSGEETSRCDVDALVVLEGDVKRAVVCGEELQTLKTLVAEADAGLTLKFQTAGFLPASGFLAYFKVQGCPTIKASDGSHLVERNGSAAIYACDHHQVFNDSLESVRFLSCVRDHHWNDTLPPCIALEEATTVLVPHRIIELEEAAENNITAAFETVETTTMSNVVVSAQASVIEDVVIPAVLIVALIVGNGVILSVICYLRRKQRKKIDDDENNGEETSQPKSQPLVSEEVKDA